MSQNLSISTLPTAGFRLLSIDGPDSERLLQGQLTCDVTKMDDQHWTLGACCTAKGRMVANFAIARQGSRFLLRLPYSQAEALQKHLGKYAVFYKATLTPLDWPLSGALDGAGEAFGIHQTEDQATLSWPDGRVEFWNQPDQGMPLNSPAWLQKDIDLGLVWVEEATRESWIPQHIHWDILGGVNFRKGCYTGQEVVARVQYLGKSKRQLAEVVTSASEAAPALLTALTCHGKTIGELAAWSGQRGLVVLSHEAEGDVMLGATPAELRPVNLQELNT